MDSPNKPNDQLLVRVFEGTRQSLPVGTQVLVRLLDGDQKQLRCDFFQKPNILFSDLPFYDNYRDTLTVIVSADGYLQAGMTPVSLKANTLQIVDLMLLPKNNAYNFSPARWEDLENTDPAMYSLLAHGSANPADAKSRYYELMEKKSGALACFFNIVTAMREIHLPQGNPLDYFKQLIWDETMAQDRFFAYADQALVAQVKQAASQGSFKPETGPAFFHPGATSSFKEVQFGEANVQLTFHENDVLTLDGINCVKVEPDIDYYKDLGAHALLEVIPNELFGSVTDPKTVYVLRWIAGRHAGIPDFNPPYIIIPSA